MIARLAHVLQLCFFYFLLLLQFPIKNLLYRYNNLSYANWSRWLRAITLLSVLSVRTCIIDYCIAILLKFVRHILTWFHIFWVIKRQSVWPLRKPQKKSQNKLYFTICPEVSHERIFNIFDGVCRRDPPMCHYFNWFNGFDCVGRRNVDPR